MIQFTTELWQSIFTPGTTPTLILATHLTFAGLVLTLSVFAFLSGSIHLINLLVLSIVLWGILTWFINELDSINQLEEKKQEKDESTEEVPQTSTTTSAAQPKSTSTHKKRRA